MILQIGIYVVMFLEILQTLMKVLMVFSILIIAFGLAFFILMAKVNFQDFKEMVAFYRQIVQAIKTPSFVANPIDIE